MCIQSKYLPCILRRKPSKAQQGPSVSQKCLQGAHWSLSGDWGGEFWALKWSLGRPMTIHEVAIWCRGTYNLWLVPRGRGAIKGGYLEILLGLRSNPSWKPKNNWIRDVWNGHIWWNWAIRHNGFKEEQGRKPKVACFWQTDRLIDWPTNNRQTKTDQETKWLTENLSDK